MSMKRFRLAVASFCLTTKSNENELKRHVKSTIFFALNNSSLSLKISSGALLLAAHIGTNVPLAVRESVNARQISLKTKNASVGICLRWHSSETAASETQ